MLTSGISGDTDTSCIYPDSHDKIYTACHDHTTCALTPTNDFFGHDACLNTFKYINATYHCTVAGKLYAHIYNVL